MDEQQAPLRVETLASALAGVPLVVLETCEGASPGEYDSAADILLRAKVDAVISYLWPVRALLSHTASKTFYETLVADKPTRGDIVAGVHAARLSILNNRASGLSMVLHVRGKASVAFDFAPAKPIGKEKPSKKPLSSFPPPAPPLEPTHTAKVIDRIHQWRPLVADCSSKKTPLLFLVHGTPHQNLKLFLDRIFEQLPRSCPRHSVVPVRRDAENTYANTEIEWKSVFLRSTGPYLADLAAFLRRETSQDHRIFVFTQDNGNPLKLDAKSTLGLLSFFANVHKQLAVPTATNLYKHALRFVIPVEHSDEGVDEHVQGLVTNLESKPALECIKLDELTFPPLHEVWQCIIEELKGSEHDAVFKAKCFATYRQVEKDPHRTVQKLGDALDPVLGEWEQKRFQ